MVIFHQSPIEKWPRSVKRICCKIKNKLISLLYASIATPLIRFRVQQTYLDMLSGSKSCLGRVKKSIQYRGTKKRSFFTKVPLKNGPGR